MKSNPEAELTILKYLCKQEYNPAMNTMINKEWFYTPEHRIVFEIISEAGRQITYAELSNMIQSKYPSMSIDTWLKNDLFRSNDISLEEVNICIDIIEEKYRLRNFEKKLMDIHDNMFSQTVEQVQTQLITYFHSAGTTKEKLKSLDEDFELVNKDMLEFGEARPGLNQLYALRDTVITIGGDSSHHKTNQLLDILIKALLHNYPKNPNFRVMFFSGEMSWKRIRDRIFAKMLQIDLADVSKRVISPEKMKAEFAEKYPMLLQDNFILVPPTKFRTVSDLSSLVVRHKPDIWGLDFLQYFAQQSAGNAEQQNKNVMEAIATIKILAEVTNSLAIVLSQLRKKSEQRQTHFPRIDDLEWSGLTKQISDVVGLCFWPYKIYPAMSSLNWYTVSWQKVRDGEPFNEVLYVNPHYCDFVQHPTPYAERKYFEW